VRLLILSQYFWPENFRINEFAAELVRRGHEVCVLTGVPNYPQGVVYPEYRADPGAYQNLEGVDVVRVPVWPRGNGALSLMANYASFTLAASTIGAWKLRKRPFDVVLVNQITPATVGLAGVVLRWLKRVPMLLWVQDLWPDSLRAVGAVRSPAILSFIEQVLCRIYKCADHILAQSRALVPRLRACAGDGVPVSYLPNWAQPGSEDRKHGSDRAEGDDAFNIFYLGNLGDAQDLPAVLDAIARSASCRKLHWYFVGDGRRADWLREQLVERKLGQCATTLGSFPPDELSRLLVNADALLVSLRREPLFALTVPSKLQTYLAMGLPIIGMLDGEGARIISEAGAGVTCNAGDGAGLAEAVATLMSFSAVERLQMGEAGRTYGEREFDFGRLVSQFENLATETIRERGPPSVAVPAHINPA
jgi:glycosyltransferase involved in cell wall biosynthesis